MNSIYIRTGARLHFGLLDTAPPFGGAGVMVDYPSTELALHPSERFGCSPKHAERILPIVNAAVAWAGIKDLPCCEIVIRHQPLPHCGLGTGTQLAMAVAESVTRFIGIEIDYQTLATQIASRGLRSGVGVHGYAAGGLIVDGARDPCPLNPIQQRCEVPADWRVVVVRPATSQGTVSGDQERRRFEALPRPTPSDVNELKGMITDEMIPAVQSADFARFTVALERYNRASGRLFAPAQGGIYHGSDVASLVESLRRFDAVGIGQSSWGPSVFTWCESQRVAQQLVDSLKTQLRLRAFIAEPLNRPRKLWCDAANVNFG